MVLEISVETEMSRSFWYYAFEALPNGVEAPRVPEAGIHSLQLLRIFRLDLQRIKIVTQKGGVLTVKEPV